MSAASRPTGALVWLRRDLRTDDHAALAAALDAHERVWCAFVFDREILDALPDRRDRRVEFIRESLVEVDAALRAHGGGLIVRHGFARDEIPRLAARLGVEAVYANRDYEPAAVARDRDVAAALARDDRELRLSKDQVVLERDEVLTGAGRPFSVFTPYRNAWMRRLSPADLAERVVRFDGKLARPPAATRAAPGASDATTCDAAVPTLQSIGFQPAGLRELKIPTGMSGARSLLDDFLQRIGRYHEARDYPALRGPSYLSVHLRFGTVPARRLVRCAREVIDGDPAGAEGARVWLSELVWREFYQQVLHHHPHVAGAAFRPEYDRIAWETGPRADELFAAWREARTGYPLVDAAMAQIERSGYMHNRLRMVAASFLTKDLGIDWRRGEAHFAAKLIDFDLAANNGGWQWAASSGCDAQPWFRIFNPVTQSLKFDPQGRFIRRYLPRLAALPDRAIHAPWLATPAELAAAGVELGRDYPRPVVDHDEARRRTLARYEAVKSRSVSPPGAGDSR